MGISIKHDEYERLIRLLANERGMSLTEAVGMAVRNEIERTQDVPPKESYLERVRRAQALFAQMPVLDDRTPDEIIGYDEYGVPA